MKQFTFQIFTHKEDETLKLISVFAENKTEAAERLRTFPDYSEAVSFLSESEMSEIELELYKQGFRFAERNGTSWNKHIITAY